MSRTAMFTIARKELRALFQSPVAILFLSVFLVLTLFLFFTQARFFARNLADVRPLFQWLPVLLIMLVSAVTMRSWAEERKAGTLEVLLTLPVPRWQLVVGKFLAAPWTSDCLPVRLPPPAAGLVVFEHAGQNLDLVVFLALRDEARRAGLRRQPAAARAVAGGDCAGCRWGL